MSEGTVGKSKQAQAEARLRALGIRAEDLTEKFVLASGSGGQKVNKTSSCVFLRHAATGIEIKCSRGRSQALNRYYARMELCDRIQEREHLEKTARRQLREKIRRQKRRRSRRQRHRMLEDKRKQSQKKEGRKSVHVRDADG